jgi:F-type H+-transporting ATPase subunit epsilon
MRLKIFSPVKTLFEGTANSVFLPGNQGEFELLDYHAPILGLLREGQVTIDWTTRIPIKKAIVKFDENECVILVDA